MKIIYHILYSIAAGLALTTLTACEDFLTEHPKGQLTTEGFFSSKEDLEASLTALYSTIAASQAANNCIGTNMLAGDDISTHPASNKQPLREYDQYDVKDNNSWMSTMWEHRFKVIKAANFIINNAERTPGVSEEELNAALGQAHYWRAYSYFYLVTTWGPVPVMLEEEIDYNAPLSSVEDIYELILSDLEIAEAGCPVMYDSEPYARNGINIAVSQGAVKATEAYVYLCMAGWPLNRTEYYQKAADKAEEVIDGVDNGTYYYRLLDDYADIHSWAYNYNNPEVLLGIYYNRDQLGQSLPLTDFLQDMAQAGWGDTNGEIKFWKDFPDGPRKEATYFPKILLTDGQLHDWWYDTDPPSREVVAPVFMKTAEGATRGTTGRAGQVTAKAVDALNRVRNRADGQPTNRYTTAMTPSELAEAAYNEHGWEIAGYYWASLATRARDMFRMYRLKDHFEFRKENPEIEVAPGVFRKEAVAVTGSWDDSKMYAPYPYEDAILNPNLHR